MWYIAIIGDIKNSKKIKERKELQEHIKRILDEINDRYKDTIASAFTITLGDEFQGLLKCGKNVMDIIYFIKNEASVSIRFAIGIGTITTDINPLISIGADGPAYYKARECIDELKFNEKKKEKGQSDIKIAIDSKNQSYEYLLNSIFSLMYNIESQWTDRQKTIINYMIYHNATQTQCAQYFFVTQSNIGQILNKTHFYAYKEAYECVNMLLSEVINNEL